MQWEYRVDVKAGVSTKGIEEWLNSMGDGHWELIDKTSNTYIFKRPTTQEVTYPSKFQH
jgi:hypothetical protein